MLGRARGKDSLVPASNGVYSIGIGVPLYSSLPFDGLANRILTEMRAMSPDLLLRRQELRKVSR